MMRPKEVIIAGLGCVVNEEGRMKTKTILAVILALFCLYACGGIDIPSDKDAFRALENYCNIELGDNAKIVSFNRTNGTMGHIRYTIYFDAELEYLKDGCLIEYQIAAGHFFDANSPSCKDITSPEFKVRQGEKRKISGMMDLEKTEKGWMKARETTPSIKWVEGK
jgi:hypothetical protein